MGSGRKMVEFICNAIRLRAQTLKLIELRQIVSKIATGRVNMKIYIEKHQTEKTENFSECIDIRSHKFFSVLHASEQPNLYYVV